ncbi:MAG: endonuclease Q family protein [Candidatus Nanoarchaeia archaeon]|nr:endonuclease Q family protein [Candidatus Nanoarchaeia archaeon]
MIADFHIHSRFAAACSKQITLANNEKYARIKGIDILGTGDFQHPKWNEIIKKELTEDENGILWSKTKFPFIWQSEISLMYSQGGKGRRIHLVVLAPGKEVADQIIEAYKKRWRIDYDGRPIFGTSCIEFTEMLMGISKDIEIIPAHAFTSWMSVFGSKSGFNSLQECFGDQVKHIHAIETGISSDPIMNRRISSLDNFQLVSFSDMHSFWPWRIGREATLFDCELKYKDIIKAIRTGNGLAGTIETDPRYGKYHEDGHRNCDVHMNYKDSKKVNGVCPKCKSQMTLGVEYRIEELADRAEPKNVPKFHSLIPLSELIASVYGMSMVSSKKVWEIFNKLIAKFKSEFNILLKITEQELNEVIDPKLTKVILLNREGKLDLLPGYDGVYGKIVLNDNQLIQKQKKLAEF